MKPAIAKIALGIFSIAFLATLPMPSVPGGLVFIYGILSLSALIACLTGGPGKIRLLAVALLALSLILTVREYRTGRQYFRERAKQQLHQPPGTPPIY